MAPKKNRKLLELTPMNERQRLYINALETRNQIIVLGPAGTGKTYIAATYAAKMLQEGTIDRIVITRPNVASGNRLGFDPGTALEKMMGWVVPVLDVLRKHLGSDLVFQYIKSGQIEFASFEKMRGRSFEDCFVILDEAQNVTPHEMKMFLTRLGENCKAVIDGDIQQSDIKGQSGLSVAINLSKKYNILVPIVEFTFDDIVRSELCKQWIVAFYKEGL
jgi:phosphate starvation-inducible protein PhoH and related proteins